MGSRMLVKTKITSDGHRSVRIVDRIINLGKQKSKTWIETDDNNNITTFRVVDYKDYPTKIKKTLRKLESLSINLDNILDAVEEKEKEKEKDRYIQLQKQMDKLIESVESDILKFINKNNND